MKYVGIKVVDAESMTALEAEEKGYSIGKTKLKESEGYGVTYPDGYKSWCPKDVFKDYNRKAHGMNYVTAQVLMDRGFVISREAWEDGQSAYLPACLSNEDYEKMVKESMARNDGKCLCTMHEWTREDEFARDYYIVEL